MKVLNAQWLRAVGREIPKLLLRRMRRLGLWSISRPPGEAIKYSDRETQYVPNAELSVSTVE